LRTGLVNTFAGLREALPESKARLTWPSSWSRGRVRCHPRTGAPGIASG